MPLIILGDFMWPLTLQLTSVNRSIHESGLGGGAHKLLEGHPELVRRRRLEVIKIQDNLLDTLYLNVTHRDLPLRPGEGVRAVQDCKMLLFGGQNLLHDGIGDGNGDHDRCGVEWRNLQYVQVVGSEVLCPVLFLGQHAEFMVHLVSYLMAVFGAVLVVIGHVMVISVGVGVILFLAVWVTMGSAVFVNVEMNVRCVHRVVAVVRVGSVMWVAVCRPIGMSVEERVCAIVYVKSVVRMTVRRAVFVSVGKHIGVIVGMGSVVWVTVSSSVLMSM